MEFKTSGSSDDTTNTLLVAQGNEITLTYAEPNASGTGTTDRTGTATMFADTATAALDATRYDVEGTVALTVTDIDQNTDVGSPQNVVVNLKSSTDATGILVTLTETGDDTGVFTDFAGFTTGSSSDPADDLQVAPGDTVTLTYVESLFDGESTVDRTDTATMFADTATATLDATSYDPNGTPELSVTDADGNLDPGTPETVEATLVSTTDGTDVRVELTESGADTGVFDVEDDAVELVDSGSSADGTNTLRVTEGDTITLTYAEPEFDGDGTTPRTDTATVNDLTDPTVAITSPAASARVRATIAIAVTASDNVGVSEVEVFVDGVSKGTDTTEPYSVSWNTTTASNGSHTLTATAEDAEGNTTTSSGVTVTVDNTAPAASFTVPTTLTGSVTVSFNEDVKSVRTSNTVLRVTGSSSNLKAKSLSCRRSSGSSVSCTAGPVRKAILTPSAALTPGQYYTALVNPSGVTTVTDTAGNKVATNTKKSFRASRTEQENSAAARYRWDGFSASSAYGGSYVADHYAGASSSYTFTGTSVTWYTVTGKKFGKAQVLIDGASKGTFNQYASSTHYKVPRTFKSLSLASHTITIKVLGQKGSSSGTDTLVAVDAVKVGSGSVVSSPKLTHTWRRAGSSSASGGAYSTSNLKGSDVSLTFRGTGIDWYTITGSNQGKVNVYIDNKLVATVDNYSSSTRFNVRRSIRGLSNAVHTIRIRVNKTKNAGSSGTRFRLDRWGVV